MIHALAHVDTKSIGKGTKIWQFASVIRNAVIGEDCNIGSCSIIDGAVIGNRCLIGHGAQLHPGTVLMDDVFVGPGVVFCNDRFPSVSKDRFEIACLLAEKSKKNATVIVCEHSSIGANATVLPGIMICGHTMIAAGTVVDRDVPPHHLFKRDGSIVKLDKRQNVRMRFAA